MVVEYIRYVIPADRYAAFIQAYALASEQLDDSEYCLEYELTQCEENPESFIVRIEWTSSNEHLRGFRKSPKFTTFLGHVRPFFADIE